MTTPVTHTTQQAPASIAYEQGLDNAMVCDMLGHTSIQVTVDWYTHIDLGLKHDAADRIGAALAG